MGEDIAMILFVWLMSSEVGVMHLITQVEPCGE